jgi:hypothetical protein
MWTNLKLSDCCDGWGFASNNYPNEGLDGHEEGPDLDRNVDLTRCRDNLGPYSQHYRKGLSLMIPGLRGLYREYQMMRDSVNTG